MGLFKDIKKNQAKAQKKVDKLFGSKPKAPVKQFKLNQFNQAVIKAASDAYIEYDDEKDKILVKAKPSGEIIGIFPSAAVNYAEEIGWDYMVGKFKVDFDGKLTLL